MVYSIRFHLYLNHFQLLLEINQQKKIKFISLKKYIGQAHMTSQVKLSLSTNFYIIFQTKSRFFFF